jgi:hypothetical protein
MIQNEKTNNNLSTLEFTEKILREQLELLAKLTHNPQDEMEYNDLASLTDEMRGIAKLIFDYCIPTSQQMGNAENLNYLVNQCLKQESKPKD